MSKNLFDYATKELSQDAFLRWLFESYKDKDIEPCVRKLLNEFCGIDEKAEITEIKTRSQWKKIDIEVDFVANSERHLLYIEDKTRSEAHNQLEKYNKAITDKNKGTKNVKRIFYKTYWISEQDKKETGENVWATYNIDQIYDLFKPFSKSNNIILEQYVKHISGIYRALRNTKKPLDNEPANYLKWEGYFRHISKAIIEESGYKNSGAWKAGPYPYICLVLRKNEHYPYLEIRSRDCLNNKFEAVLLCYGLEGQVAERQKILLQKLKEDEKNEATKIFSTKRIIKEPKDFNKQIGRYISKGNINTDEAFISELKKCATYYDELMTLWDISIANLSKEDEKNYSNQLQAQTKGSSIYFSRKEIVQQSNSFFKDIEAFKHFFKGDSKSKIFLWNHLKEDDVPPQLLENQLTSDELAFYRCWWKYEHNSLKNSPESKNINYLETKDLVLCAALEEDQQFLKNDFSSAPNDFYQYTLQNLSSENTNLDAHCHLKSSYTFSIRQKKTNRFLGVIKLFDPQDIPDVINPSSSMEMAYYILSKERNKGYATQAVNRILKAIKNSELKELKSTNLNYVYEAIPLECKQIFIRPLNNNTYSNALACSSKLEFKFNHIKTIEMEYHKKTCSLCLYAIEF